MKHTPAPWKFQLDSGHLDIFIKSDDHKEICIVRPPYFAPGDFRERVEHELNKDALANAQLIAAAPLMYKELERAMKTLYMLSVSFPGDIITGARNASNDIKAVLAKATL